MNSSEINYYKSLFVKNSRGAQEFSAAATLTEIQNIFTQREFGIDKWYTCSVVQLKKLKAFMDKNIYETL